jgi:hypothetical protein
MTIFITILKAGTAPRSVSFAHFTSTFMRIQGWMQH